MESDQAAQHVVKDEELEELLIAKVQKDSHNQEWKATLQVNNNMVEFKLDTEITSKLTGAKIFRKLEGASGMLS